MVTYTQRQPSFLEEMLSSGLQSFGQQQQMGIQQQAQQQQRQAQRQQALGLGKMLGLDESQLESFVNLSPEQQKIFVDAQTKGAKEQRLGGQQQMLANMLGIGGEQPGAKESGTIQGGEQLEMQGDKTLTSMLGVPVEDALREPEGTLPSNQPPAPQAEMRRYSQQEINAATMINPQVGRAMADQNKASEKALERKASLHSKANEKYFSNISERAEILPQKQSALQSMIDAIEGGDLSFFAPDSLADITGVEAFRTPEGAQFISSGKEYFLGSLRRAGARPNQWIEQQIQKMLPRIGRSREANLTVAELLKNENDIERKQIELAYELANELEANLGYVPRDLPQRVNRQLKPFAEEQQALLENRLREITGDTKFRKVKKGTPINKDVAQKILKSVGGDKDKARKKAKGLGYEF